MNSKIPFEVVNTNLEHSQDLQNPTPSPASQAVEMTETAKPTKKLKARKVRGLDFDAALSAVAEMPELTPSIPTKTVAETVAESLPEAATAEAATNEPVALADLELQNPKQVVSEEQAELEFETIDETRAESFESSAFEEFGLLPCVVAAIEASGYSVPTPIQTETIPHVLDGRDIIGRAETGSGKTAAFACPLLSMIDLSNKTPQVLVLTPTRELAIQVTSSFEKYGAELKGFRAVTIYGGQSYEPQTNALRRGVQVVVGTPGRVMDHLRQGTLVLSGLKTIVLDEGDEMLRMGFIDDVEWILEQIPAERQTLLFSATMPAPIQKIAQNHLRKPVNISIESDTATAESIAQSCVLVQPRTKIEMLAQILESEETDGVIVFVKTRDTTVGIADQLSQRGFAAAPLNGEIPQNQRERTIAHLKSGRLNVLVATDVAARGLDVQRISHVINFDFPHDTEAYIHRIGRTGRAGREGTAILFVEPKEQGKLKRLQRETNQRIDNYRQKSVQELNQIRIQRFKDKISKSLSSHSSLSLFSEIVSQFQRETQLPFEQIAVGLAAMAQGDSPLLLKEVVNARSNWKSDGEKKGKRFQGEMTTYRVEVGRNHGVGPGNIVGAITNEVALDYAAIGKIKLFDDFSTIDLPANLPSEVLNDLKSVVVSGQRLQITRDRHFANRSSPSKRSDDRRFESDKRPRKELNRNNSIGGERPSRRFASSESSRQEQPTRFANRKPKFEPSELAEQGHERSKKFGKPRRDERSSTRVERARSARSDSSRIAKFERSGQTSAAASKVKRSKENRSAGLNERGSSKSPIAGQRADKKPAQRKFIKLRGAK
jgi:ATP-dependent RNA helicase DeaD